MGLKRLKQREWQFKQRFVKQMASFSLKCRLCDGKFGWEPQSGFPRFCPLCGQSMGEERDGGIGVPAILSAKTRATDKVYRDIERGSEKRVELAAQTVGAEASDMAALKITDLRDNMREGDIAANEAEKAEARLRASTRAPLGYTDGAGYSDGIASGAVSINGRVVTGIEPHAGARAVQTVQRMMGR